MDNAYSQPARLERLFAHDLISRRELVQALTALGVTLTGVERLIGTVPEAEARTLPAAAVHDRYLVIIVMDGFRADYATLAPMHHLQALMARGTAYDTAWVGHLESETPTGHATIATGAYPRKHSIIGFGWRDLTTSQFTWLPTSIPAIKAGALTRVIEAGGVPTISDLIHSRNPKDLAISLSGEKYYAAATMGAGANYVLYGKDSRQEFRPVSIGPHVVPAGSGYQSVTGDSAFELQDQFAATLAIQLVRSLRPRALLVNLPGVDSAGHYYGGMRSPRDMTATIKGADLAVGRIVDQYRQLGLLDRTIVVVTADHGMAANRHIVPIHPMYRAVAASVGSTLDEEFRVSMGSIWMRQPSQDRALAAAMVAKHFPGIEGALYKVASGSGWSFQPDASTAALLPHDVLQAYLRLADTEACVAGPEVILAFGEDTLGLTVKNRKRWGAHGGFSWGVQHIPMIIAGPGVRHGTSQFPAKLVDVAPTVERLIGLPIPPGVDGVTLADALSDATARERAAQTSVAPPRLADIRALRAHSAAQSSGKP
ncbi:MAG TPA: alkaline phosphatase family protein [Chloroflexota bacterium]